MSRRDELAVSGSVLSEAPWAAAAVTGAVVAGGDLILHLMLWQLAVSSLTGSLSLGAIAFFAVAGGGALRRGRGGRALGWARRNPWRFAVLPGAACAIVVFVLAVLTGSGLLGGAFTALWHGAAAYGLTGLVGSAGSARRRRT